MLSLVFAIALSRSETAEAIGPIIHVLVACLFFFVLWFVRPYEKWIWSKLRRPELAVLLTLFVCAFAGWLLGMLGVPWVTLELFFGLGWAILSFGMFAVLLNLPRVKKFNA